jgi:peptidoglycan-N-acetylglucosamine deacetylase
VLLAGRPPASPATDSAGPKPAAPPTPEWLTAAAPVLDRDGVQRRLGATPTPAIALTFDDGPDPRWTPTVLDLLRRYRIRATFCLVGQHVVQHPELVRRIADDGHALCDHTWSHDAYLQLRPPDVVRHEIDDTYRAIVAASGGVKPRYFRAPAGRWASNALAEARREGLRPLGWSVDPLDWRRPPPAEIARRVLAGAGPGKIVLMHDGYGDRANTVAALPGIVQALAARNLRFTVP